MEQVQSELKDVKQFTESIIRGDYDHLTYQELLEKTSHNVLYGLIILWRLRDKSAKNAGDYYGKTKNPR